MKKIEPLAIAPLSPPPEMDVVRQESEAEDEPVDGVLDNPRQELYAQLVSSGYSGYAAYMRVYKCDYDTARSGSGRLNIKPHISARIKALQGATAAGRVMTNLYRREFLFELINTPISEVGRDSRLVQKYKTSESGEELTLPGKLEAIKLDAQLAGELSPNDNVDDQKQFPIGPITITLISNIINGAPLKSEGGPGNGIVEVLDV